MVVLVSFEMLAVDAKLVCFVWRVYWIHSEAGLAVRRKSQAAEAELELIYENYVYSNITKLHDW
jgi:hypothetical protein